MLHQNRYSLAMKLVHLQQCRHTFASC
uniref:Uncharacterized protein n=1 Tax=Rhizophora mucronata TaxID=61149 RepID=A0A2P2PYX3_RHIMU